MALAARRILAVSAPCSVTEPRKGMAQGGGWEKHGDIRARTGSALPRQHDGEPSNSLRTFKSVISERGKSVNGSSSVFRIRSQ